MPFFLHLPHLKDTVSLYIVDLLVVLPPSLNRNILTFTIFVSMMLDKFQCSFNNNTYGKALHAAMCHITSHAGISLENYQKICIRDLMHVISYFIRLL